MNRVMNLYGCDCTICRVNPLAILREMASCSRWSFTEANLSHITFDPTLVPEYRIIRGQVHDGLFVFTFGMLHKVLLSLVNQSSYYIPTVPDDLASLKEIRYTVGWLRLSSIFRRVHLPVGWWPGVRERLRIPVKCEYVFDN